MDEERVDTLPSVVNGNGMISGVSGGSCMV